MAQHSDKLAKRYARALLEASPIPTFDELREALNVIASVWEKNVECRDALLNPAVQLKEKIAFVEALTSKAKNGDQNLLNFAKLLVVNGRIDVLPRIAHFFGQMVDEFKRLLALQISSAFPLTDSDRQEIQTKIEKDFGSTATISWDVDKSLIGGLIVKSGDRLLDGSMSGKLDRLSGELRA